MQSQKALAVIIYGSIAALCGVAAVGALIGAFVTTSAALVPVAGIFAVVGTASAAACIHCAGL